MAQAIHADVIYSAQGALPIKYAPITASSGGATAVVAAVAGRKIRVIAAIASANAATNVKFMNHTAASDISGIFYITDKGGFVLPANPFGWCETAIGDGLDINLSGAVAVGGQVVYVEA